MPAQSDLNWYVDSVKYAALPQWAASTAYTAGTLIRQLATPTVNDERVFICVVAGTSAATEPAWTTTGITQHAKVTDGTVTWYECSGAASLCGDVANTAMWQPAGSYFTAGVIIKNLASTFYFILTTTGTSGAAEPTWNTTTGATTTDNSCVWTCLGPVTAFSKWQAASPRLNWPLSSSYSNPDNVVWVADEHAETYPAGGTVQVYNDNQQVICVDHTASQPYTTANFKTTASVAGGTSMTFNGGSESLFVYGIQFSTNTGVLTIGGALYGRGRYEQCLFSIISTSAVNNISINSSSSPLLEFFACTFHFSNAQQAFQTNAGTIMRNCAFTGVAPTTAFTNTAGVTTIWPILLEACDLSLFATNLLSGGVATINCFSFTVKDCKLSPTVVIVNNTAGGSFPTGPVSPQTKVDLIRCDSGAAATRNERYTTSGAQTTSTSVVRSGGAVDGATPVAHRIVTGPPSLSPNWYGLWPPAVVHEAIPLVIWNDAVGANRTLTFYGMAVDTRVPTNTEVWFDVEYLGSPGSPLGAFATSGPVPNNQFAPGSPLSIDSSAWDSAAPSRANSTAYVVGNAIKTASNPGRVFVCIGAGTSAASEPAGTGNTANTWNPNDADSHITLSNGNLTAASTSTTNGPAVRGGLGASSGLLYFEVKLSGTVAASGIGVASLLANLATVNSTAVGAAFVNVINGNLYLNSTLIAGTIPTFASGDTVCVAVNLNKQLIWFRKNGGSWNNGDPAYASGGLSTAVLGLPLYPLAGFSSTALQNTANFSGPFVYPVPSGYSAWNGRVAVGYNAAMDGDLVVDGSAYFRSACRFFTTLTLGSPQPQMHGYLYVYPKFARPNVTFYLDPLVAMS